MTIGELTVELNVWHQRYADIKRAIADWREMHGHGTNGELALWPAESTALQAILALEAAIARIMGG